MTKGPKPKDMTNQVVRSVLFIRFSHTKGLRRYWECRCHCGKIFTARVDLIQSGHTRSCGCAQKERKNHITHGLGKPPEYNSWSGMIQRCCNPKSHKYPSYGGRGICVCDRWRTSFANFYTDMGARPNPRASLERIDNDGNYEPGNCRWATKKDQAINRRKAPSRSSHPNSLKNLRPRSKNTQT